MNRSTIASVLVMLLLGVAGGLVWVWLADPARWEVRRDGIVLTEAASRGQFSVIVLFVAIGAVSSLVWAFGATWRQRDLGWVMTPVVAAATIAAALLAWRIGVTLGPPSPQSVRGASIGDMLPSRLAVDGVAPFLAWPVFGLAGVLLATWLDGRTDDTTP